MIPPGATGLLYRPAAAPGGFDRNGDPIDANGDVVRQESPQTFLGTLRGILQGGPSASQNLQRGDFTDTTGKFGIPIANGIKVKYQDRIVIGDTTYQVTSRGDWDYPNGLTGTMPEYAWHTVVATTGANP
jgi:hypothetical protein